MEWVLQGGAGAAGGLPAAQLEKIRELVGAAGSSVETRLLAQTVLDLNALVSELMKTTEGMAKKRAFRVGG